LIAALEKRILEGGALLLAGSSGNFRRSAVNLMAFKHKLQLVSPQVVRNANARDFGKDMKAFIEIAAGQNRRVLLLLEDHQLQIEMQNSQLQKSEILEKVNSLISSGEIPGLLSHEEIEHIVQDPEDLKQ
jgi:dynein heavy chain 2